MQILRSPKELRAELDKCRSSIGFVPTMGALHKAHSSLISKARDENEVVVVSIFVNPTQFLEGEDLLSYPRTKEQDIALCKEAGVDLLFYPDVTDIYGKDEVSINAPDIRGYILEGSSRAGHFSGMLTVVNKLLNLVSPTRAYFGRKDAQQLLLIEAMVEHFFMRVQIVAVDTMREDDGLAYSSRNRYLNKSQRVEARKISQALKRAEALVESGVLDSGVICKQMREMLSLLDVEYITIVDIELRELKTVELKRSIVLVEVLIGNTRLIDNIWL